MRLLTQFATAVRGVALSGLVIAVPAMASAQEDSPPSTNPAERVVYGSEGQDADQQAADQLACYNWAGEQTGWDPYVAYKELEAEHGEALAQYQATQGSAVKGAAKGALAGLAIGAIAGDAGKGAAIGAAAGGGAGLIRGRRGRQAAEAGFEQAAEEFKTAFQGWDRNWVACMQGRKYSIT
jgi:hypothetical protein